MKVDREWALSRVARALGVAGYSVEECDAIMAWLGGVSAGGAIGRGSRCAGCDGTGKKEPVEFVDIPMTADHADQVLMIQGLCLACRGTGVIQ